MFVAWQKQQNRFPPVPLYELNKPHETDTFSGKYKDSRTCKILLTNKNVNEVWISVNKHLTEVSGNVEM